MYPPKPYRRQSYHAKTRCGCRRFHFTGTATRHLVSKSGTYGNTFILFGNSRFSSVTPRKRRRALPAAVTWNGAAAPFLSPAYFSTLRFYRLRCRMPATATPTSARDASTIISFFFTAFTSISKNQSLTWALIFASDCCHPAWGNGTPYSSGHTYPPPGPAPETSPAPDSRHCNARGQGDSHSRSSPG